MSDNQPLLDAPDWFAHSITTLPAPEVGKFSASVEYAMCKEQILLVRSYTCVHHSQKLITRQVTELAKSFRGYQKNTFTLNYVTWPHRR